MDESAPKLGDNNLKAGLKSIKPLEQREVLSYESFMRWSAREGAVRER